jgi:hypothetical protein
MIKADLIGRLDAPAARNGRASLRHDQSLDRCNPLPDETLPRVAAEMALHVLAYNMTRVMNIMGTPANSGDEGVAAAHIRPSAVAEPPRTADGVNATASASQQNWLSMAEMGLGRAKTLQTQS